MAVVAAIMGAAVGANTSLLSLGIIRRSVHLLAYRWQPLRRRRESVNAVLALRRRLEYEAGQPFAPLFYEVAVGREVAARGLLDPPAPRTEAVPPSREEIDAQLRAFGPTATDWVPDSAVRVPSVTVGPGVEEELPARWTSS